MHTVLVQISEGKRPFNHLEELGVGERVILNWILEQ
jgi:sortase (surface protein transpeptidase)